MFDYLEDVVKAFGILLIFLIVLCIIFVPLGVWKIWELISG